MWLGSAATNKKGLKVGPLSMLMVFLLKLIPDGKQVPTCPTLGKFAHAHREWYRETLTALLDSLAAGRIKPVVAERIPLAEAARAHELLERSGHSGKVVLVTGRIVRASEPHRYPPRRRIPRLGRCHRTPHRLRLRTPGL